MEHQILFYEGPASDWYWLLFDEILKNHQVIPCTQGIGLESPNSLVAILPSAENMLDAFASVYVPRYGDTDNKITFSLLYSLRRILGYHETVLIDKYPILKKYLSVRRSLFFSRPNAYLREEIPSELSSKPWVSKVYLNGFEFFRIDQIKRAVYTLSDPERRGSRTCLIDFGDGYKSRCVMSWLFLARNGNLNAYNQLRSNDLFIGMPNDLVDIRLGQCVLAAATGLRIGFIQHQASIVQIYTKDIAGRNQFEKLQYLRKKNIENVSFIRERLSSNRLLSELITLIQPLLDQPENGPAAGIKRYIALVSSLKDLFWKHNLECSSENKESVWEE